MPQSKADAILAKLDERKDAQHATAATVNELNVHIKGNGGKGLHQRMNETEAWREEWVKVHPLKCPLDTKELSRRQARILAIWGAVVATVAFLSNLIPMWLKGG